MPLYVDRYLKTFRSIPLGGSRCLRPVSLMCTRLEAILCHPKSRHDASLRALRTARSSGDPGLFFEEPPASDARWASFTLFLASVTACRLADPLKVGAAAEANEVGVNLMHSGEICSTEKPRRRIHYLEPPALSSGTDHQIPSDMQVWLVPRGLCWSRESCSALHRQMFQECCKRSVRH